MLENKRRFRRSISTFKVSEVDEERNRLVLSHRRALVEKKMNRLEVGSGGRIS